jgi:hypothetical protein
MEIRLAQYIINEFGEQNNIRVVTESDAIMSVPLDPANRHYTEIMRQVEAGELTIQEAE